MIVSLSFSRYFFKYAFTSLLLYVFAIVSLSDNISDAHLSKYSSLNSWCSCVLLFGLSSISFIEKSLHPNFLCFSISWISSFTLVFLFLFISSLISLVVGRILEVSIGMLIASSLSCAGVLTNDGSIVPIFPI